MARLTDAEIDTRLASLPGWSRQADAIVRVFTFEGFPEAVAFVGRLVPQAEAAAHHPDVTIHYRRVTLSYSTHDEQGITEKDFEGARAADGAVAAR